MVLFRKIRRANNENGLVRSTVKGGLLSSRLIFRKKTIGDASTTQPTIQPSLTISLSKDEQEEGHELILTPSERRIMIGPITSSVQDLSPRNQQETSPTRRQTIGPIPSTSSAFVVPQYRQQATLNASLLIGESWPTVGTERWQQIGHEQLKKIGPISSSVQDLSPRSEQQQAQEEKSKEIVFLERKKTGPIISNVQDLTK